MNDRTRTQLEFLARSYVLVRSSTLRLLRQLTEEELSWRPAAGCLSSGALLGQLAAAEDVRVQRRLAGRSVLSAALANPKRRSAAPSKQELARALKKLKTATAAFLRELVFERRRALAPDVFEQVQSLVFRENQCAGQIRLLRAIRAAEREKAARAPRQKR
jgi:hypothetical protein